MTRFFRTFPMIAALAVLLVFPMFGQIFYTELVAKTLILAIFAMSLDLLVGYTGLVSFGHAAYFGIAAYAIPLLTPAGAVNAIWWILPVSVLAAALAALLIGVFVLRTKGIYFIRVTLAFAQMAFFLFHDTDLGGGSDGIFLNSKPTVTVFGLEALTLENPTHIYYFVLALTVSVYLLLRWLLKTSFGHILIGIRSNEHRMVAMGYNTFHYKLAIFTIAGALAGLAGFLQVVLTGFVTPEMLAWHQSGNVLLVVILGGIGTLIGPVLGAFTFIALQEFAQGLVDRWQLVMGIFIILVVFALPGGLAAIPARLRRRLVKGADND